MPPTLVPPGHQGDDVISRVGKVRGFLLAEGEAGGAGRGQEGGGGGLDDHHPVTRRFLLAVGQDRGAAAGQEQHSPGPHGCRVGLPVRSPEVLPALY